MASIARKAASLLPEGIKDLIIAMYCKLKYRGTQRKCPVCEKTSSVFLEFGVPPRKDAACPHCGALERDRLTWLFLKHRTDFCTLNQKRAMLHVAPERAFEKKFRAVIGDDYVTADLYRSNVSVKMDITDIDFPDEYFDIIYCSHVLEHVLDDTAAMREFYRVMKRGGWAILNVPVRGQHTFEDASIIDPDERERVFGQSNHVRIYGEDYIERLRIAGFSVEKIGIHDLLDKELIQLYGLTFEVFGIYHCRK